LGKFDEETYGYLSVKEYFADLINAGCFYHGEGNGLDQSR